MKTWKYRVTIYTHQETVIITNPLTCKGTVTKGLSSGNNSANLQIYNLAPDTRTKIYQAPYTPIEKRNLVKIEVGYSEDNSLTQIFFGAVLQAYSQRSGGSTDVITNIEAMCLDLFSQSSHTFKAGTSYKDAIKTLANDLPTSSLYALGGVEGTFLTDTTFDGNTLEQINKIAGGGASLDDGLLNVCLLNEALSVPVPIISDSSILLETPVRKDMNVNVKMLMYPELILGQLLQIESGVWADFNGQYKVISFTHDFLISESAAGTRTTTANLLIGVLLPSSDISTTGGKPDNGFKEVKREKVQPIGYMTPASAIDVYRYLQNNNGAIPNTKINSMISWKDMLGHDNSPADRKKEVTVAVLTNCYNTAQNIKRVVNKYFPGKSITVTSGWRSVANNASCGGKSNSQHLYGKAIDFIVNGVSIAKTGNIISQVWDGGYSYFTNEFVHADLRNVKSIINDV